MSERCPSCGHRPDRVADAGRIPHENVHALRVKDFMTVEWHNKPVPVGRADCVAFVLELDDDWPPIVVRLKSAEAVDNTIAALERHRNGVWPDAPRRDVS